MYLIDRLISCILLAVYNNKWKEGDMKYFNYIIVHHIMHN